MATAVSLGQRRVKHLRLFHFRDPDSSAVRWLLQYIEKSDAVDYIEVNGIAGETVSEEYRRRNPYQTVPFLEVILEGTGANPSWGTKRVADLTPWKPGQPCTVTNATGDIVADPSDRVFPLTETGAICAFLCEHFEVPSLRLDPPRSHAFQRCRVQEVTGHNDLLARRIGEMVIVLIFTKAYGATEENVVSAITVHERELLWTFRQMEDTLILNERAAATAAGVDYEVLVQKGVAEVAAMERDEARAATTLSLALPQKPGPNPSAAKQSSIPSLQGAPVTEEAANASNVNQESGKAPTAPARSGGDSELTRGFTSPDLVALSAYMAGTTLSVADFCSGTYIQHLPFLQSWLPGSLKQRNFPAMLRYIERLRGLRGHGEALKPSLTLMKAFRRRPQLLSEDPLISVHAHRLKQLLDARPATAADGQRATNRSDPRLLPQQHSRAAERAHPPSSPSAKGGKVADEAFVDVGVAAVDDAEKQSRAAESENAAGQESNPPQEKQSSVRIRGRPQNITPWAARMSAAPLCHPHTLTEQDEAALLQSKRPVMKRSAQSVDTRKMPTVRVGGGGNTPMPTTMSTIPSVKDTTATFTVSPGEAMATTARSRTVQPSHERRAPESQSQWWHHDPYKASPMPTAPAEFSGPGGMGMGLPPHLMMQPPPPSAFLAGY